jgi:hypothetical protein
MAAELDEIRDGGWAAAQIWTWAAQTSSQSSERAVAGSGQRRPDLGSGGIQQTSGGRIRAAAGRIRADEAAGGRAATAAEKTATAAKGTATAAGRRDGGWKKKSKKP